MRPRIEQPTVPLILQELQTGPATDRDLSHVIGIHYKNIRLTLKEMKTAGLVRICGWERKQGAPIAVWTHGKGKDANRPKPLTDAERMRIRRRDERRKKLQLDNAKRAKGINKL